MASEGEWNVDVTKLGDIKYDVCKDHVEINEKLYWLHRPKEHVVPVYDLATLHSWRKVNSGNCLTVNSQRFIDASLYLQLFACKTALRQYNMEQLQNARLRSNAFENIKEGGIFINRAAMKMANLDAILKFQLTNPNSAIPPNCKPLIEKTEPLFFADICAGPGGFSEYFLWRKRFRCKGFGFTLKGDYDFNLSNFVTGTDNFVPHYGEAGDGNINDPLNVNSLTKFIYDNTDQKGVHIVTGDGGIDFGGQEEYQEPLTKQILLAQVLVAISILRPGGHFVCKTFDLFTPFSVGLIYLLSMCFSKFCIHKPNTSRPANSERYLICQYKRENTSTIQEYLRDCHELLWKVSSGNDLVELVPVNVLTKDSQFFQLAIRQILGLQKLLAYAKDNSLSDPRQRDLREQSLGIWNVQSDGMPHQEAKTLPKERFLQLKGTCSVDTLNKPDIELVSNEVLCEIKSPYDWRVIIVGGSRRKRGYYFGFGHGRNYYMDHNIWRDVPVKFNLPKDTIVYGEIVEELLPGALDTSLAFHIIDALILDGEDIRNFHFNERHALCAVFVKTMKKTNGDMIPVRTKRFIKLENLEEFYEGLTKKDGLAKGTSCGLYSMNNTVDTKVEDQVSVKPTGLLFLKITADPWMMAYCKRSNLKYWYHTLEKSSTYTLPPGAIADFNYTARNKIIWILAHSTEESGRKDQPQISKMAKEEVDIYIQGLTRTVTTA